MKHGSRVALEEVIRKKPTASQSSAMIAMIPARVPLHLLAETRERARNRFLWRWWIHGN